MYEGKAAVIQASRLRVTWSKIIPEADVSFTVTVLGIQPQVLSPPISSMRNVHIIAEKLSIVLRLSQALPVKRHRGYYGRKKWKIECIELW